MSAIAAVVSVIMRLLLSVEVKLFVRNSCKVDILSGDDVILRFLGYGHSDDISIGSNGKLREGGVGVRWSS